MVMVKVLMRADGFPMRHEDIYREFGIVGNRLPDEGLKPRQIQGIWIWVEPKIPGMNQDGMRTIAACPHCDKWTGFAKLRQHMKVH
jgi:hypothetical protein